MAQRAVSDKGTSIRLACSIFGLSESGYRYCARLNDENQQIARWLIELTGRHRSWGFGLCFLFLRNVKGFSWNHKRIYRIYCELKLNLRIKPKQRLIRPRPAPLIVPEYANHT